MSFYETHTLFIWADGILYKPLDLAVAEAFKKQGILGVNVNACAEYLQLREQLALGKIDSEAFFEEVHKCFAASGQLQSDAPAAMTLMKDAFAAMTPVPEALSALSLVKSGIKMYVVVDIPEDSFMQLPDSGELLSKIPDASLIFSGNASLPRLLPDVLGHLSSESNTPMENCLLLDHDQRRPISALRHGMPAEEMISPMRLKRELLMRGLVDGEYCMHRRPV